MMEDTKTVKAVNEKRPSTDSIIIIIFCERKSNFCARRTLDLKRLNQKIDEEKKTIHIHNANDSVSYGVWVLDIVQSTVFNVVQCMIK